MPFIGNQPALSYTSFAKQDFTTSATTSYTLDNPVANENELALFINFVRQEPTTAYTASGTSLTLTSATSASDDMYCVYLGKAVQTVNPPNGSVGTAQLADSSVSLAKLSATGTKDSTTFLRGDNTFASAGGNNTPAFEAYVSTSQSFTSGADTKIQFDAERFDTNNVYDNSTNYRFTVPSGQAGKYYVYTQLFGLTTSNDGQYQVVQIFKNGSRYTYSNNQYPTGRRTQADYLGMVMELSVGDYIEIYIAIAGTSPYTATDSAQNYFGAYKIIE